MNYKTRRENSKSIKDDWGRGELVIDKSACENYIARSCIYPFQGNTASQRRDLMNNFETALIIPTEVDIPIADSALTADAMKYCSCIRELRGEYVTLLAKFSYQLRTIYIYEHDGIIKVYDDNNGTIINQRAVNNIYTDFDNINVGDTVNLADKNNDTFYLKYPSFFNPTNGLIGYGRNIRCKIDVELDNSQDSVAVSESFLDKFISRKTKVTSFTLSNKEILSKYSNLLPKPGELIEDQFLCKIVQSDNDLFKLAQSSSIPSGEEDETIVLDQTSILTSIEVYCNNPIEDPVLESYRKSLLKFRLDVYYKLNELLRNGKKLDHIAYRYLENFGIDKFRTNHSLIEKPLVVLRVDSLNRPAGGMGYKFSNRYGGKYTVQRVYKDGFIKDEFGNNIDLVYGALGIINRMIPSALIEVWFTGFQDHIKRKLLNNETTITDCKRFYEFMYTKLEFGESFANLKLTDDEWYKLITELKVPIIFMPVSTHFKLGKLSLIRKLARELFEYDKVDIYINNKHCRQRSTVGYMYTVRLYQDPEVQTSAVGTPELDSRGLIKEDDDSKKKGLAIMKRKSSKLCVQTMHLTNNLVPDQVSFDWLCDERDNVMKIVEEHGQAIGLGITLGDNNNEGQED